MPRTRVPSDKGRAGPAAPRGPPARLRRAKVLRQAFALVPGTSDFIRRYLAAQEAERALYADVLHQGVYPERSRRTDLIRVLPALIQSAKRGQIDSFQIHKLLENSKSNQTTKSHSEFVEGSSPPAVESSSLQSP